MGYKALVNVKLDWLGMEKRVCVGGGGGGGGWGGGVHWHRWIT